MCFSVMIERDLSKLARLYQASINEQAFEYFYQRTQSHPDVYKMPTEDGRIYAKSWAPIITFVRGKRELRPMRYQLLPSFCEGQKYTRVNPKTGKDIEIKSTYNARLDSLFKARAWQKPFMNFHGIVPVTSFFEWVDHQGKSTQIEFTDPDKEILHVPCLYDNWYSQDKSLVIQSFAIITTDPTKEVLEKGHDRSPINLDENEIQTWLDPKNSDQTTILDCLKKPLKNVFQGEFL
ncbi:MAG: hypothetical protein CME62_01325 [Halobacteriovoraceae bacterium]|nr:hypothetical protein [Halobacteriovoraceae bacterium]